MRLILHGSSPTNNQHRVQFNLIFSLSYCRFDHVVLHEQFVTWYAGYAFADLHSRFPFLVFHARYRLSFITDRFTFRATGVGTPPLARQLQ
jgi:hypothetical protein